MRHYHPDGWPDLTIIEPRVFSDERGSFFESYHEQRYQEAGIPAAFVQDNHSRSLRGVLRGLHFQKPRPQGKLVRALLGSVYDVTVDIRVGSAQFGNAFGIELSAESRRQLYVPPGFAHGFLVLSDLADFEYKCTDYYAPEAEHTLAWNDPALKIRWPDADEPRLSAKDASGQTLEELRQAGFLPAMNP